MGADAGLTPDARMVDCRHMTRGLRFFGTLRTAVCVFSCAACSFAPQMLWGAGALFPKIRHVIHISADGLGGVYLSNYLAQTPEEFPAFGRLRAEGAGTLNARCDYDISVTEPNHASILTGRPILQQPTNVPFSAPHGLTMNYDPGPPFTLHSLGNLDVTCKASVFDVAHDRGLVTAFFAGKDKFILFARSYDEEHGAVDAVGEENGTGKIDLLEIIDWAGPEVFLENSATLVAQVARCLAVSSPGYTFVHLADLDIAGHYYGWGSEQYRDVVRHVDRQLGRILASIEADPSLQDQTAIVFTADHGGGDAAGSHIDADDRRVFTIPLLVWGPGVPAGLDLYELCANRTEPGAQHLDHDAPQQPLRNGDSGNIALALLGLPPIPGSCLIPEFKPWLRVQRTVDGLSLSWPAIDGQYDLERSGLSPTGTWSRITTGIGWENGWHTYRWTNLTLAPLQFFRLNRVTPR